MHNWKQNQPRKAKFFRRSIEKGDVDGITTICIVRCWDPRLIIVELGDGGGEEEAEGKEEAEKSLIHTS